MFKGFAKQIWIEWTSELVVRVEGANIWRRRVQNRGTTVIQKTLSFRTVFVSFGWQPLMAMPNADCGPSSASDELRKRQILEFLSVFCCLRNSWPTGPTWTTVLLNDHTTFYYTASDPGANEQTRGVVWTKVILTLLRGTIRVGLHGSPGCLIFAPVNPASRWAATSNVEIGQMTYPVNRERVGTEGSEGSEGQSHKE